MPAIRYSYNKVCAVVLNEEPCGIAEVKGKLGEPIRVDWFGFVCERGVKMIQNARKAKILAGEVTNESGFACSWHAVRSHQYVMGLIVLQSTGNEQYGVYGIVDKHGWPIVRSEGEPHLTLLTG